MHITLLPFFIIFLGEGTNVTIFIPNTLFPGDDLVPTTQVFLLPHLSVHLMHIYIYCLHIFSFLRETQYLKLHYRHFVSCPLNFDLSQHLHSHPYRYPSPNHPNYSKGFPFTKGRPTSTVFQNSPQPSYAQSKHAKRPHTVASFHSTDVGITPNANNSAQTFASYHSDHTGSSQSLYRPASGSHVSAVSVHSGDNSFFKSPSHHSNSAPHSRPPSGDLQRSSTSHSIREQPPSVHLSNASLGQRPLSGSSSKSVPASISHSGYNGNSGHNSPMSINSSRSVQRSQPKSHVGSRHSSGRSSVSRRGLVPAATSLYRYVTITISAHWWSYPNLIPVLWVHETNNPKICSIVETANCNFCNFKQIWL